MAVALARADAIEDACAEWPNNRRRATLLASSIYLCLSDNETRARLFSTAFSCVYDDCVYYACIYIKGRFVTLTRNEARVSAFRCFCRISVLARGERDRERSLNRLEFAYIHLRGGDEFFVLSEECRRDGCIKACRALFRLLSSPRGEES